MMEASPLKWIEPRRQQAIIDSRGGRLSGPIPQGVARTFSFLGSATRQRRLKAQVNAEPAPMMAVAMMSMVAVVVTMVTAVVRAVGAIVAAVSASSRHVQGSNRIRRRNLRSRDSSRRSVRGRPEPYQPELQHPAGQRWPASIEPSASLSPCLKRSAPVHCDRFGMRRCTTNAAVGAEAHKHLP